jgi:hypothetical protein
MKRAYCVIREQPHYRHDAFHAGLKACGFHVLNQQLPPEPPRPGDILVIWNRYSDREVSADKWEKLGGTVLVAENGYLGKDAGGIQYYALARHGHNGSGQWPDGEGSRWQALGIELQPWRRHDSGHILICGQRGIGSRSMASPAGWHEDVARRLRAHTKRPVRIRLHPGNDAPKVPLEQDLEGAFAVLVWSSSSGVKALVQGYPVFYEAPHWICAGGAQKGIANIEAPLHDDAARLKALQRMAWAQWNIEEIALGEPFRYLLPDAG